MAFKAECRSPPLGFEVRDGSENPPGRFADRELRFRRPQHGVIMTAVETFLGERGAERLEAWRAAAEGGTAEGQALLAGCYLLGQGVAQDPVAAHKWFNLAAMRGIDAARNWRNQIAAEMSSSQIALAQKLAREWLAVK